MGKKHTQYFESQYHHQCNQEPQNSIQEKEVEKKNDVNNTNGHGSIKQPCTNYFMCVKTVIIIIT